MQDDTALYRIEIIKVYKRASDGKKYYRPSGWYIVKYANSPESFEPVDSVGGLADPKISNFKQVTGYQFVDADYRFNEATGGNVNGYQIP